MIWGRCLGKVKIHIGIVYQLAGDVWLLFNGTNSNSHLHAGLDRSHPFRKKEKLILLVPNEDSMRCEYLAIFTHNVHCYPAQK